MTQVAAVSGKIPRTPNLTKKKYARKGGGGTKIGDSSEMIAILGNRTKLCSNHKKSDGFYLIVVGFWVIKSLWALPRFKESPTEIHLSENIFIRGDFIRMQTTLDKTSAMAIQRARALQINRQCVENLPGDFMNMSTYAFNQI